MCLSSIDKSVLKPKPRFAWKIFEKRRGGLYPQFRGRDRFRKNVWIIDDPLYDRSIISRNGKVSYPAGFHAYLNKKDAFECAGGIPLAVRKVKISGIIVHGIQNNCRVVVFSKMFIIEEKKNVHKND